MQSSFVAEDFVSVFAVVVFVSFVVDAVPEPVSAFDPVAADPVAIAAEAKRATITVVKSFMNSPCVFKRMIPLMFLWMCLEYPTSIRDKEKVIQSPENSLDQGSLHFAFRLAQLAIRGRHCFFSLRAQAKTAQAVKGQNALCGVLLGYFFSFSGS